MFIHIFITMETKNKNKSIIRACLTTCDILEYSASKFSVILCITDVVCAYSLILFYVMTFISKHKHDQQITFTFLDV